MLHKYVKKQGIKKIAVVLIIICALAIGIVASMKMFRQQPDSISKGEPTITYSTDKPDESKQNADNYNWKGGADEPKKIRISKINVDAFIQKAGVDQNKQIAVPNNVHLASWFSDSVRPGQVGLAIIDGHVSGRTTDGVFKNLTKLAKDDTFQIEQGNGNILSYKVLEKVELKESEAASYLFSQNPLVKSQLNLITCGGNFDKTKNQYENRVIVAAELIN